MSDKSEVAVVADSGITFFLVAVTLFLIVGKAYLGFNISWWMVFMPMLLPFIFVLAILAIAFGFCIIAFTGILIAAGISHVYERIFG